jgi:hypothetical protein
VKLDLEALKDEGQIARVGNTKKWVVTKKGA